MDIGKSDKKRVRASARGVLKNFISRSHTHTHTTLPLSPPSPSPSPSPSPPTHTHLHSTLSHTHTTPNTHQPTTRHHTISCKHTGEIFLFFSFLLISSQFFLSSLLVPRRCRHQFLCGQSSQTHNNSSPRRGLISKGSKAPEEGTGGGGRWRRRRECKNKNKNEQQGEAVTYRRIEQPGCRVGRGQVAGPGITRILNERDKVSGFYRSVVAKYKRDSWFLSITNLQFILHASLTLTLTHLLNHSVTQSITHTHSSPRTHSLAARHPHTPPSLPPRTLPLVSASLRFVDRILLRVF